MSDFRLASFDEKALLSYGKVLGRNYYWKVFASENILRIVINSVLSVQVDADWWLKVVDHDIVCDAKDVRQNYLSAIPSRDPGRHGIYCTYLSRLERILFKNRGSFIYYLPNVDDLIVSLNAVLLPRNLMGHMNHLTESDRRKIGELYGLCENAVDRLKKTTNIQLKYP